MARRGVGSVAASSVNLPRMRETAFLEVLFAKSRMRPRCWRIPVRVILNDEGGPTWCGSIRHPMRGGARLSRPAAPRGTGHVDLSAAIIPTLMNITPMAARSRFETLAAACEPGSPSARPISEAQRSTTHTMKRFRMNETTVTA